MVKNILQWWWGLAAKLALDKDKKQRDLLQTSQTAKKIQQLSNPTSSWQVSSIINSPERTAQKVTWPIFSDNNKSNNSISSIGGLVDGWVTDFDVFKQNQLSNLWVSEDDFLNQSWISFDSFRSEFNNLNKSGWDVSALDNFIGEQFRTLRDTNQWINQLQAKEWALNRTLQGADIFFNQRSQVNKLINQWVTDIDQIAARTWYTPQTVQSLINNDIDWFQKATWTDVTVSKEREEQIKEQTGYDIAMQRAQEDFDFNKSQWELQLEEIKQQFDTKIERQQTLNKIQEQNLNKMIWFSWAWYSNRWALGIENILQQSKNIIDDMKQMRNRAVTWVETYLDRLAVKHERVMEDLQTWLSESIINATNATLTAMDSIKSKYGEVSEDGIQKLRDAQAKYVETLNDYNNQTFQNMSQQFTMLQQQIQLANSINEQETQRAKQQAEQLINQWASFTEIQSLVNSWQLSPQVWATAQNTIVQRSVDTLDSISGTDGVGELFREQIIQWLSVGRTAQEVLQEITASPDFLNAVPQKPLTPMEQLAYNQAQLWYQQWLFNFQKSQQEAVQWWFINRDIAKSVYGTTPAVRNFNPWNITDLWFWGKKVEWERFTVFDTPEQWFNALISKIQNIQWGGSNVYSPDMSLTQFFNKYAPSSDGNKPDLYAQSVASDLWVTAWTKVWDIDAKMLAEAISKHEDGNSYRMLQDLGIVWWWEPSAIKESYLELLRRGQMNKSDQIEVAKQAEKEWRSNEFDEALNQWLKVTLTDTQLDQYNKERDVFRTDPVVKWFEESLSQFQWLSYSLSDRSWPWDMAWIFSFMKTLDPTSVVREAEFESAANSAGVASRWKNIYNKLSEGKLLTEQQAEDFKRIAQQFIETKAQSYDRKYDDMVRNLWNFWVDEKLLPTRATDQLRSFLEETGAPQQSEVVDYFSEQSDWFVWQPLDETDQQVMQEFMSLIGRG